MALMDLMKSISGALGGSEDPAARRKRLNRYSPDSIKQAQKAVANAEAGRKSLTDMVKDGTYSPYAGYANILSSLGAGYQNYKAERDRGDRLEEYRGKMQDALDGKDAAQGIGPTGGVPTVNRYGSSVSPSPVPGSVAGAPATASIAAAGAASEAARQPSMADLVSAPMPPARPPELGGAQPVVPPGYEDPFKPAPLALGGETNTGTGIPQGFEALLSKAAGADPALTVQPIQMAGVGGEGEYGLPFELAPTSTEAPYSGYSGSADLAAQARELLKRAPIAEGIVQNLPYVTDGKPVKLDESMVKKLPHTPNPNENPRDYVIPAGSDVTIAELDPETDAIPSATVQTAALGPASAGATGETAGSPPAQGIFFKDAAQRFSNMADRISQATGADKATVDRALHAVYQIESSGGKNRANQGSSARGDWQFIGSTAKAYGLNDPMDRPAADEAMVKLTIDNINALQKRGIDVTPGTIYGAHQQGSGGFSKLMANPNARAVDIVGHDAVVKNGGNAGMSAGEFAKIWTNKADNLAYGKSVTKTGGSADGGGGKSSGGSDVESDPLEMARRLIEQSGQPGARIEAGSLPYMIPSRVLFDMASLGTEDAPESAIATDMLKRQEGILTQDPLDVAAKAAKLENLNIDNQNAPLDRAVKTAQIASQLNSINKDPDMQFFQRDDGSIVGINKRTGESKVAVGAGDTATLKQLEMQGKIRDLQDPEWRDRAKREAERKERTATADSLNLTGDARTKFIAEGKLPEDPTKKQQPAYKDIQEAEAGVAKGMRALETIKGAIGLNNKTGSGAPYSGGGARERAAIVNSILPTESSQATAELDSRLKNVIIPNLKSIFGANSSNSEMAALFDALGNVNSPPATRRRALDELLRMTHDSINQHRRTLQDAGRSVPDAPAATPSNQGSGNGQQDSSRVSPDASSVPKLKLPW